MDVWYSRVDVEELVARWFARGQREGSQTRSSETSRRRGRRTVWRAFKKLTRVVDGEPRIVSDPPLIVPIGELFDRRAGDRGAARLVIREYRRTLLGDRRHLLERFRLVDAARKVVGVGSVGTRAYILLFLGRDDEDPLFLQMKEAEASVLEPFLGKSGFANHGQRVVEGQRLMQAASDTMLGWIRATGVDGVERDFYLRQLWDSKGSAIVEAMDAEDDGGVRGDLRPDARPRARPLRRRRSRSRATSARATPSTARSRLSPRRTPTRTSGTTPR